MQLSYMLSDNHPPLPSQPCVFFSSASSTSIHEDRDLALYVSHLQNKISWWHHKFSCVTLHPIFVCTQWHKFCKDSIGPLSKFSHLEQSSSPPSVLGLSLIYINFKIYTLDAVIDIWCEALIHSDSKHLLCSRSIYCNATGTTGGKMWKNHFVL